MTQGARHDPHPDLPEIIPVFPLPQAILLPHGQLPLNIFEPRYLNMVDDALSSHRLIGMVQPSGEAGPRERPALYKIGGLGRITAFAETDDGRYLITLTGVARFEIIRELPVLTPYRQVQPGWNRFEGDLQGTSDGEPFDRTKLLSALRRYFLQNQIQADWPSIEKAPIAALVNSLSMIAPVETSEKQALLESPTVKDRADILIALIELALANRPGDGDLKPN